MVGSEFIDFIRKWNIPNYISIEDFADKFNFLFTTCILIICSLVLSVKQYFFNAIVCFCSSKTSGSNFESYMENICWISGTYPKKITDQFSNDADVWRENEGDKLHYYQWVPFILGLQCVLFYVPRVVWLMIVHNRTGADLQYLVTQAGDAMHADGEKREKIIKFVARSMEHMLFVHRDLRSGRLATWRRRLYSVCNLLVPSKRLGTTLIVSYLIVKCLYLANAVGQVYLMQRFLNLGTNYTFFGAEILADIMRGRDWEHSMVFPRVTFCRFELVTLAARHPHTAQCALPVNMLNEKIYVFLWFWVALAAVITAFSIPAWLVRVVWRMNRSGFIRRFLKLAERYSISDRKDVDAFVVEFLRHDGVFVLKMMQINAGDVVTGDIVLELFSLFKTKHLGRDMRNDSKAAHLESPYQLKKSELNGTANRRVQKRPAPSAPLFSNKEFSSLLLDPEKPEKIV